VTGAERGPDDRPIDSALAVLLRLPDGAHQGIVDTTVDGEAGFDDGRIKAAVSGQVLVLALPNQLVYSRLDGIEAGRPLGALFVPLALSLDEAANAYLIVERGKTQRYLWAVTREGNRFIELPLPAGAVVGPPLVAHDHRVFVLRAKSVLAVGQPGKILWQTSVGGSLGGALVSGDDRLVASIETPSGVEVVTFDDAGKATSLFRLPGESRPTPPALGEDGDLYLATESLDDQKRPTAILRRFTAR
jgi:hypothetical protein